MKKIQVAVVFVFMAVLILVCWMLNKEDKVIIKLGESSGENKIVVGTLGKGEPYSKIDEDGMWTGYEAELWGEIQNRTGITVELKQAADTEEIFEQLKDGEIDVAANCFAITKSRLEEYVSSGPLYADVKVVSVRPDSQYKTFEDIYDCTVGVSEGQVPEQILDVITGEYGWNIELYEDANEGYQDLADEKIEAYIGGIIQMRNAEKNKKMEFRILGEEIYGNHVGWWFANTDEGIELRDMLNMEIAEMQMNGTLSKLAEKWFYDDLTQYISDKWVMGNN